MKNKTLITIIISAFSLAFLAIIAGVLIFIFSLSSLDNKTPITSDTFVEITKEARLKAEDVTKDFEQYGEIKEVYSVLGLNEEYQIVFLSFSDSDNAKSFYSHQKAVIEDFKNGGYSQSNTDLTNVSRYALTSGGVYQVISRIQNTVIYAYAKSESKSIVKDILDKAGY